MKITIQLRMWVEIVILLIFVLIVAIGIELTQKLKSLRSNFVDTTTVINQVIRKRNVAPTYVRLAKKAAQDIHISYDNLEIKSGLGTVLDYQRALMVSGLRDQIFEEALQKYLPSQPAEAVTFRELKKMFPYIIKYPTYFNTTNFFNMCLALLDKDVEITIDYVLLGEMQIPGATTYTTNIQNNIKAALAKKIIQDSNYYKKNTLNDLICILPVGGFNSAETTPDDLTPLINYLNIALTLQDITFLQKLQKLISAMDFQQCSFPITDYDNTLHAYTRDPHFIASLLLKLLNKTAVPNDIISNLINILESGSGIMLNTPTTTNYNSLLFPPNEIWTKADNQDLTNVDIETNKKLYSLKTYYPNQNYFNLGTGLLSINATFLPFTFQCLSPLYTDSNPLSDTDKMALFNFVTIDDVPRRQSMNIALEDNNYTLTNSSAGICHLSRGADLSFINTGADFTTEGGFKNYCYMDNEVQSFCAIVNTLSSPNANATFTYLQAVSLTIPDITASNYNSITVGTTVTILAGKPFCVRLNNQNLWMCASTKLTARIDFNDKAKQYTITLSTSEFIRNTILQGTEPITFYMFSLAISDKADNLSTWSLQNYGTAPLVPTMKKPSGYFAARVFLHDLHSQLYDAMQFVPFTITAEAKKRMVLVDDGGSLDLYYCPKSENDALISVNSINANIGTDGNIVAKNLRTVFGLA